MPLTDRNITKGETVVLECEVNKEEAEVKWFQNGKPIKPTTKNMKVEKKGAKHILTIKNCSEDSKISAKLPKDETKSDVKIEGRVLMMAKSVDAENMLLMMMKIVWIIFRNVFCPSCCFLLIFFFFSSTLFCYSFAICYIFLLYFLLPFSENLNSNHLCFTFPLKFCLIWFPSVYIFVHILQWFCEHFKLLSDI